MIGRQPLHQEKNYQLLQLAQQTKWQFIQWTPSTAHFPTKCNNILWTLNRYEPFQTDSFPARKAGQHGHVQLLIQPTLCLGRPARQDPHQLFSRNSPHQEKCCRAQRQKTDGPSNLLLFGVFNKTERSAGDQKCTCIARRAGNNALKGSPGKHRAPPDTCRQRGNDTACPEGSGGERARPGRLAAARLGAPLGPPASRLPAAAPGRPTHPMPRAGPRRRPLPGPDTRSHAAAARTPPRCTAPPASDWPAPASRAFADRRRSQ